MLTTYKYKKLVWTDLDSPTSDEIRAVMKKYPIHPLVAEELLYLSLRPRVDVYKDIIYLILHFPVYDKTKKGYANSEIDFIVGKNFLVTTHYREINVLHELGRMFETNSMPGLQGVGGSSGLLFFHIVKQMYEHSVGELSQIQAKILAIEEEIFDKNSSKHDLVRRISHVRTDILDFRRTIHPHHEILSSFKIPGENFFGRDYAIYISFITGAFLELWHMLENNKETIESLQDTNDSLLSHRTNEIIKTLTIMAFSTFPLMLIIGLFSTRAMNIPIVGARGDFWIILAIVVVAAVSLYTLFKKKRWI